MANARAVFQNNVYTVMLGLALLAVLGCAAYVAIRAFTDYGALFQIAAP